MNPEVSGRCGEQGAPPDETAIGIECRACAVGATDNGDHRKSTDELNRVYREVDEYAVDGPTHDPGHDEPGVSDSGVGKHPPNVPLDQGQDRPEDHG
jgi:hypothetical protein